MNNFFVKTGYCSLGRHRGSVLLILNLRVPYWVTFNESNLAVGLVFKTYNGLKNVLFAHADVYHWYKKTLNGTGNITLKFANYLAVPQNRDNPSDLAGALRYQDFLLGIMANPLFLGTQFPSTVLSTPNLNLTTLTDTEIAYLHNAIDSFSVDPYVAQFASSAPDLETCKSNIADPLYPTCVSLTNLQSNNWLMDNASNDYAYISPQYVRSQLGYIWNTFHPSGGILVSEFGFNPFADAQKSLDAQR